MVEPKNPVEKLTDLELAIFINNLSKELVEMAKERGLHSLIPSLRNTAFASENVRERIKNR